MARRDGYARNALTKTAVIELCNHVDSCSTHWVNPEVRCIPRLIWCSYAHVFIFPAWMPRYRTLVLTIDVSSWTLSDARYNRSPSPGVKRPAPDSTTFFQLFSKTSSRRDQYQISRYGSHHKGRDMTASIACCVLDIRTGNGHH